MLSALTPCKKAKNYSVSAAASRKSSSVSSKSAHGHRSTLRRMVISALIGRFKIKLSFFVSFSFQNFLSLIINNDHLAVLYFFAPHEKSLRHTPDYFPHSTRGWLHGQRRKKQRTKRAWLRQAESCLSDGLHFGHDDITSFLRIRLFFIFLLDSARFRTEAVEKPELRKTEYWKPGRSLLRWARATIRTAAARRLY